MKIIFFGLGSIGLRHAVLLQKLKKFELYAYRSSRRRRKNELGITEVMDWKKVEEIKPNIAFVTNPTFLHIDTALKCAQRGMHLFIEKPLGSDIRNLNKLLKTIEDQKLTTYVAYVLRFHPVIRKIKAYLKRYHFLHMRVKTTSCLHRWRQKSNPRRHYSGQMKLGGGVIYELSHEFDYVQHLLGDIEKIHGQFGKRSHLTHDAEDYADILLETRNGPVNVHINFLSQRVQRTIEVDFREKCIEGDLVHNRILEYQDGKLTKIHRLGGNMQDCYTAQMVYFLANINNRGLMNNVVEATQLFKKIYAFKNKGRYDN